MIDGSEELDRRLHEAIADLRAAGLTEAARSLEDTRGTAYTTGSEWRGEITRAVRSILGSRDCPRGLRPKLSRLLQPGFAERVVIRQLWQGIRTGTILLLLAGAAAAIATAGSIERFAPLWTAGAAALVALLWISTRRSSVCPGCGRSPGGRGRYGTRFPSEGHFCSSCGARLPAE